MMNLFKFVKYSIFCLSVISIALSSVKASEKIAGPDGSSIIHLVVFNESGLDYKLAATEHSIYSSLLEPNSGWSVAKKLYSFPLGESPISEITLRNFQTGNIRLCYILLTDGTVYEFMYNTQVDEFLSSPTVEKPLNIFKQKQTRNLVVSTSYYLISSTIIYINRRDGKGWMPDTSGFHAVISTICLDKNQNLIAATNMGLYRQAPGSTDFNRIGVEEYPSSFFMVYYSNDEMLYAISQEGYLYRVSSEDSLMTDFDFLKLTNMRLFKDNKGILYASGNTSSDYALYRKRPSDFWEIIDTNIRVSTGYPPKFNDISGYSTIEGGSSQGMFSSFDGGITWAINNTGIESENYLGGFVLNNGTMIVQTNSGIFKRTESNQPWKMIYPIGNTTQIPNYKIQADRYDNLYIYGFPDSYHIKINKSTDIGDSWNDDTKDISKLPTVSSLRQTFYVDTKGGQHLAFSHYSYDSTLIIWSKQMNSDWAIDNFYMQSDGNVLSDATFSTFGSDKTKLYVSGTVRGNDNNYHYFVFKRKLEEQNWTLDTTGLNGLYLSRTTNDRLGTLYASAINPTGRNAIFKYETGWKELGSLPVAEFNKNSALGFDYMNTLFTSYDIAGSTTYKESLYATSDNGNTWFAGGISKNIPLALSASKDSTYAFTSAAIFRISLSKYKYPKIKLSSDTLDFGKIRTNAKRNMNLLITNSGDDTLFIYKGAMTEIFSSPDSSFKISPGENRTMNLTFKPKVLGKVSLNFKIFGNIKTHNLLLTGEGILTDSSAKCQLSKDTIDFGLVESGKSKDTAVVFNNTGLDTLHVYSITTHVPYFYINHVMFDVPPGGNFIDTITFQPTDAGKLAGIFVVKSNIQDDTIFIKGMDEKQAKPLLKCLPNPVDFGTLDIGRKNTISIWIFNAGYDTIFVKQFISSSSCFTVESPTFTSEPFSYMSFGITFKPLQEKIYDEFIEIITDSQPDTLFVKGIGKGKSAVDEQNGNHIIVISPNPVIDFLNIQTSSEPNLNNGSEIRIYNVMGHELNLQINFSKDSSEVRVDVSGLSPGVYFIIMRDKVEKFVKI